ncbi:MAG: hypothetical protein RMN24_16165, partial [Anaerolineae bacterium]|nr:hypothetical protein [Anaerolineae bacterium]
MRREIIAQPSAKGAKGEAEKGRGEGAFLPLASWVTAAAVVLAGWCSRPEGAAGEPRRRAMGVQAMFT